MAAKPCTKCGVGEKVKGGHHCFECNEQRLPAAKRELLADWRLEAIPPELRRARVPQQEWPPGRRWCAGCQTFVRLEDCGKTATQCKTCTGRKSHAGMLTRTYVIHGRPFTADDYAALYRAQGGRCHICGARPISKRLAVDHDHESGEVRGLLCPGEYGCNYAVLGNIKDIAMAERIVDYLRNNWAHSIIQS